MGPALLEQPGGQGMDMVKRGLERLELVSGETMAAEDAGPAAGKSLEEAIHITDIDPLTVDLPLAIAQLSTQLEQRRVSVPEKAEPIFERLRRWADKPQRPKVGEVMNRISALLLAEGLDRTAIEGLKRAKGPAEWMDGQFTQLVAAVFRPVLVDLVARWTLPEAPAAVFHHLGASIAADRMHISVAYAAGCLLPTAPQIRGLVMAYFRTRVPTCIAEQALAATEVESAEYTLVVTWRLLRRLPEVVSGVEAWGWEAPLAALMSRRHSETARLLACECLSLVKALSDRGRAQLLRTLEIDSAQLARTLAWLEHGEQQYAQAARAQLVAQNRTGFEQRIWCESGDHRWLDESQLSSCVASVGGVLLHAHESARNSGELVVTPLVARNIHAMALATSRREPVLLQGAAGSGKTSLVEWVARRTGNELVTIHLSGNMDAKVLLGNYVTTQRAGDFEWQPGLLTTAVTEGRWVLVENIDLAPPDVIQTLLPLLESHTLFVASRGQSISAHVQFRLFATLSADARAAARADGLLGSSVWTRLEIGSLDAEMAEIIRGAFPGLADDAEALARAFRDIRDIVADATPAGRGPALSTRDLIRWCTRLRAFSGDGFARFQEAVDTFTLREPDYERWRVLVQRVGAVLGVAAARVDQYIDQHSPGVVKTGRTLKIGRAALTIDKAAPAGERMPFADTHHSRRLLERIAACVRLGEPALLMGETGTGKTTVVQHLAALAGRTLSVFNLSQQSDASDLLGGFRPVDIGLIALRLRESFDVLFARTVSVRKNAAFLDKARAAFGKRDWKRLIGLYRAALKNARQMLAAAREQLNETQGEPPSTKRARLTAASVGELAEEWDAFERHLGEFEAMRGAKMAFSFVEGALVKAARTGAWILLDEVNLASPETLACLGGLLQRERSLLLAETGTRVACHPEFRLFACMNPATDVGKRDLPPALRSSFSEMFVHAPDANSDDLLAIVRAHLPANAPAALCHRVIAFYRAAKARAAEHALVDGANQRPHYSLRTLTRGLTYAREHAQAYSLRRALYDGLFMTFATQLEGATQAVLVRELHAVFAGENLAQILRQTPPARGADAVLVQGFWLPTGREEAEDADSGYVITRSVEAKIASLARAVMCGRYPVLIQGPTSAGKTSMVQHLARVTGHKFVRINNHEHTDLQEYLGAYASVDGRLVFEEGLLVKALRHGHWLVLDELNLAPSDVLEALNRLLDDNRELVIPETQELVRPHPHFMLFATQNPAGLYGGRKALSRAFRNRFVELHFDDIPEAELQQIIVDSCQVPPTHARLLVDVYRALTQVRAQTRIFEASHGFITLRDMFRWANRHAASREELAEHGYMLLAERVRSDDEKHVVRRAIERAFFASTGEQSARARRQIDVDGLYSDARVRAMPEFQALAGRDDIAWTAAMRRLFVLTALCVRFHEPVLLVGETGCGKTTVCQMLAAARGQQLRIVNCHQNTESSDILGSQRPVRNRAALLEAAHALLAPALGDVSAIDSPEALQRRLEQAQGDAADVLDAHRAQIEVAAEQLARAQSLFAWHDGPLVQALKQGDMFLMDELNLADDSVLERLNSVLEPSRTLVLAENVGAATVRAHAGFEFVATMNPGGDYGKRELSPALRNRFTELWAPATVDRDDLALIIGGRLRAIGGDSAECARIMLDFVAYLRDEARVLQHALSLRDYLFWAEFIARTRPLMDVRSCVVHGACMVLLDAIGAQGSAFGVSTRAPAAVKADCVQRLRAMVGWTGDVDTTAVQLGVVPARDAGAADLASLVVTATDGDRRQVGVRPFLVEAGAHAAAADSFALHAPTTFDNLVKILRAMQVGKPLLLEGSPGVGKTTLVSTLARIAGHRLVRINLSDQTDLMDLFGTDLPVDDGFAWCDAPFLQALKRGDWVLLDEINLASQSVLEGLNSCLDHRGTVYISELDREFTLSHGFRLFAAQNPLGQGGGRKGLPRSFVNRFTQVYMDELQRDDLQIICAELFPAHDGIDAVLEFNWQMHQATMGRREFGAMGAPWEFNLRDVSRFMELALTPSALERAPKPVDEFIPMLYEQRMRTPADRLRVRDLFASVFGRALAPHTPSLHVTEAFLQVGNAVLPRRPADARLTRLRALATQLPCLESLMKCIEMRWMAILVGSAGAGKTSLVRWLAAATGNRLVEFSMNSGVDTSEILGGFEQVDMQRHRSLLLRSAQALVDRILVSCDFGSPEWSELAAHACALLQQARRSDDKHVLHEQMSQLVTIAQPVSSVDGIAELTAEVQRAADAFVELEAAGRFEWVDGVLVDALERGAWLLLDRANLCSASVLDRLNGLLEPNGVLYVNEDPKRTGPVVPHPDFRIIMAVDPQHGELSRAMRNRGIEICMLPAEPECILDDQMTVARALGVSGELLAGVQRLEGSMNELVQSAVHVAERVERGYPAWVESTADSAGDRPSLQPRALNATVAVASWQAQLAALSLQSAPQDVDASTWRQRMLLAALSTVPPDAQALDTRVLAAIVSDRLIGQVLAPEQPLALELVQARKLLADESQVSATLLPSAPTYVQLNLGLFRALERQADRPVARWHQALQATRLFQMERMLAESNSVTGADGNLRELVLQRPNVDVVHVQSLFALLDGCDQLLDDWEQQVAAAKGFDSDMVPVVWHLRTIHTMKARLQLLLEHEQGTASEQAVALEGMQGALQKLRAYAGPVGARAAELVQTAGQLVLDATHSARIWALAHPATLPDARMRELEARLGGARQQCMGETASEIVEALAMLYAAGSRKNKDLIVDAVAKFVESLPVTETPATAATVEIVATPASVLADVTELSQWRQMLCAALIAGSLPRRSTGATRAQAVARLRTLTSSTTVGQSSPWALLLTRLSWLANESDGSSALLSLFTDAAYQWYGRLVSGSDLEPFIAAPAQRLGRAVATELAWKSAARLNCALGEHDRAAQESHELLRALAAFEPEEESVLAQVSELVAQLTVVARATSTADVPMPETERLLAALLLDGQPGVDRKLANAWRAELMHACAAVSTAVAPATDAVLLALGDSLDPALAWVAAVETSACVLRVAVPRRPVDPAAKAHAQWAWLGDDVRVRRADVAAYQAVHRSMAGAGESPVVTAHVRDMARLEQSRTEIELVYRPAENAPRFAELWHEAHTLEQTVVGRIREAARQLADEQLTGEAFDRMQGAVAALQGTLAQFEARVQARYFAAFRDQAQVWLLCVRQMGHALAQLNELRRRAVRVQVAEQAQLVRSLYMQPMGGLPADPESTEHLQTALGQLKTLIYLTPEAGSPLSAYGELLEALLLRVVLGVQVRGVLAASDLASVDLVLRDAYEMHKRATDEQRRRDQEAASLFRFKATEDPTDEQIMGELFPGFEDVFDEDDEQPTASFADIPEETVDVLATCHQYLMLQFGVLEAAPDVRGTLVADAQRQVLQLAASLHMRRPELAAVPAAADRGLRGANVAALAAVLQSMSTDAADAAHLAGVRAEYVYDFYRDACVSEAVQLTPIVSAIAARTVQLQLEWPEHAVLEQIGDMAGRLLQLPATAPLAKLLAGVEQLHERAQDWQAYASRDVAIAELADVARLIIRWRQRELNSWPHLLRAQELASARQANRYWFGLYAALAAPEHVELSELVAAVDHFMQGSPAGEFRGRLNMLQAFAAHRGAVLAASAREQSAKTLAEIRRADSVYGPLLNAVGYYAQFATCIARQLDAAKQAVAKDLAQYVKISSWKDVNPAALRASAQKTHKHLAKCVRRWREALAQPIFQIVQAQQTAGIVTAQVPEVTLELLPLAGAGLDIAPPPSLAALPAGLTTQPWELAVAESDMTAAATDLAQLAEAGVARVLAGSAKSLAQLAKHMAAAPVFGGAIGGSSALEQFAEQIAGDISHFQRVEAPSHLVKRSGPAAAAPVEKKKKRGKILIKSKKEAEAPAYVDDDEERQRQLQQFWGEQRNLRRTRLKDIMRALQELGLKRHARAGDDAPGLTQVLQQQPLDVDAWRESVRVAAALAPAAVLAGSAQAQRDWQMADALFFRLSAQLAQLRSAAFAEHSAEVGAQQVQHILGLGESLNAQVTRDRQAAAELLAAAASWMQAAAPWGSEQALGACVPVARLRRAVDALAAQLAQFGESARAVNAAGGWADAAAVSRVLGAVQVARERVAQAQAQLGAVDSGAAAAQLAGSDATAMLGASAQAAAAAEQAGAAARAVSEAIGDISAEPTRRALAPWLEPTLAAAAQVQRALDGAEPAAKAGDGAELASVAGQWATAVLNVWQSIGRAEEQFGATAAADVNGFGMAPKELVRRVELAQRLARALHLPTMQALCARLTRLGGGGSARAARVVRAWVRQYSLIVQHVVALSADAHRARVRFALGTAAALTSVVAHGMGSTDALETEAESRESQGAGTGMGEGSTAGAQNVSDQIEGEDQVEGVQGEQEPEAPEDPGTNEDAVDMQGDFQGQLGDADLETDSEDSDAESDSEDEEQDLDEQMGDVDPTDPTALDDKLWDDEEKNEAKDEDSKVDGKAQTQDESDIVAGDEDPDTRQDPDQGQNQEQELQTDDECGSDDEGGSDGELDDRVNQDTLDRMADAEDQAEQLEMPDDLDMGSGDESEAEDDGLDADMAELPEDEPIEQQRPDEPMDAEAGDEADEQAGTEADEQAGDDSDEQMGGESDAEPGSVDGDEAGDDAGGDDEAGDDGDDAASDGGDDTRDALGEDAPADERQHSGEKPTHGVDSAMNMDGDDDVDPSTSAESRDAASKPAGADSQQQASMQQQAGQVQPQDAAAPPQNADAPDEAAEPQLNPERTLADVIDKWERRLDIVMRDEAEAADEPAPEDAAEFEHVQRDQDFDKVALADATEHERDQQDARPMDIDEPQDEQPQDEPRLPDESQPQDEPQLQDEPPASKDAASSAPANPQREHAPDAAQMQRAGDGRRPDSDEAMAGSDREPEPESEPELDAEEPAAVDVEQLRLELEQATAAWRAQAQDSAQALELWQRYTRLTRDLALLLTEQLRLVLTPTQATQLRGDYRTGKRLNMKRIIPYIASEFRKDKIWLRRTKPARREYQVMVALDNSKSMAQTPHSVELAYETLALVTTALTQLEVGQLALVSFGEHVSLLHPFDAPFDAEAGARALARLAFADDRTDVVQLLDASLRLFEAASASAADLWRLQLVISDGVCQDHARLLRQVRAAMEQRVMIVFIVLDRSAISPDAAVDPEKDSIMNTQHVAFVRTPSGSTEMKVTRYLDTFPFQYYVVLRDIHGLPSVLAETLRQYFSLVGSE